ncbi:hypothetical protein PoB_007145300 [Plakobranchus ocellatus]|uniref:Uncharacterized protein n=1 Tax=Plakobranchus ocellatus TaxID=259542 RepID=A0AAV4DLN7_9GAST|nr:hypothetical protein PoB_007145300 [Plakobranchus ocellatus]
MWIKQRAKSRGKIWTKQKAIKKSQNEEKTEGRNAEAKSGQNKAKKRRAKEASNNLKITQNAFRSLHNGHFKQSTSSAERLARSALDSPSLFSRTGRASCAPGFRASHKNNATGFPPHPQSCFKNKTRLGPASTLPPCPVCDPPVISPSCPSRFQTSPLRPLASARLSQKPESADLVNINTGCAAVSRWGRDSCSCCCRCCSACRVVVVKAHRCHELKAECVLAVC